MDGKNVRVRVEADHGASMSRERFVYVLENRG